MLCMLLLALAIQENEALRFSSETPRVFPGEAQIGLRSNVEDDDFIGLEIFVNGESVHYFETRPFETRIDLSLFDEGEVVIEARLERYDGTVHSVRLHGSNHIPDHREEITMVRIPVLALGREPGPEVGRDHFKIFENGDEQSVALLLGEEKPLDLLVLLDMSGSMHRRTDKIFTALDALMDLLEPEDRLHVIGFNHLVFEISPPETDMTLVRKRLRSVEATGPTNLYGALWSGIKTVDRSQHRRAILLFTDGDHDLDDAPDRYEKTLDECISLARGRGIPIYAVGLGVSLEEDVLDRLTRETGGTLFVEHSADRLHEAFAAIGEQLRHQYLICYYTQATRSGWYDIRITSDMGGPELRYPKRVYLRF